VPGESPGLLSRLLLKHDRSLMRRFDRLPGLSPVALVSAVGTTRLLATTASVPERPTALQRQLLETALTAVLREPLPGVTITDDDGGSGTTTSIVVS
jgi:hypothetical protein